MSHEPCNSGCGASGPGPCFQQPRAFDHSPQINEAVPPCSLANPMTTSQLFHMRNQIEKKHGQRQSDGGGRSMGHGIRMSRGMGHGREDGERGKMRKKNKKIPKTNIII